MKTRTHFAHRIDEVDARGEVLEHLAGVEDYEVAEATCVAWAVEYFGGTPAIELA
jgi:hypothetical protein